MDRNVTEQVAAPVTDERLVDAIARPAPFEPIVDRCRAWVAWFGFARIVVSAVSMIIVCTGAFWLVRSPQPSAEAGLPQATSVAPSASPAGSPSATLPVPEQLGASGSGAGEDGAAESAPTELTVHVAGAVVAPGVYRLEAGDRIDDAIRVAGGPSSTADVDALNLAAVLADGVRVYVPEHGEVVAIPTISASPGASASGPPAGPIDVNRADAALLDSLPGVGPATAAAIVAERERNGPFLTVADLERVPGIGPAKLAGLINEVTV